MGLGWGEEGGFGQWAISGFSLGLQPASQVDLEGRAPKGLVKIDFLFLERDESGEGETSTESCRKELVIFYLFQ